MIKKRPKLILILSLQKETFKKTRKSRTEKETLDEDALSWHSKRLGILNRFTTNEKLSISTSFLSSSGVATGVGGADISRYIYSSLQHIFH